MDMHRAAVVKEGRRTRIINVINEWINQNDYVPSRIESIRSIRLINQSINQGDREDNSMIDSFIRIGITYVQYAQARCCEIGCKNKIIVKEAGIFIPPPSSSSSILVATPSNPMQ